MKLSEIFKTMLNYKKQIVVFSASAALFLFLILYFAAPITYSSKVTILPPEDNGYGDLGAMFAGAGASIFNLGGQSASSQLYAEIIKSRSAAEYVSEKSGLKQKLNAEKEEDAVLYLQTNLDVSVTKEGIINVFVPVKTQMFSRFSEKKDSVMALSVKLSNLFVEALDKINREKIKHKAGSSRKYLEEQLDLTKTRLNEAEENLRRFQEENKAISLPDQLSAAIENAALLKSRIMAEEISLNTLQLDLDPSSQEVLAAKKRLAVLRDKYKELEAGTSENDDYLPSFGNIPDVSLELARLTRDVRMQNELYLILQKQYYSEKIQEEKNTPTIQVLDAAVMPMKPDAPRPLFHTFIGGIAAFLLISAFYILRENKKIMNKKNKEYSYE